MFFKKEAYKLRQISAIFIALFLLVIPAATQAADDIEVWWPTDYTPLSGTQPLKGLFKNRSIEEYTMYWQVEGGNPVLMDNSYEDYPHKEAIVDFTNWKWNASGIYKITFTVLDSKTNATVGKTVRTIYHSAQVSKPASNVADTLVKKLLSGEKLYRNPNTTVLKQIEDWKQSRPLDVEKLEKIANQPQAIWLGSWMTNSEITTLITKTTRDASKTSSVPVFVLYNIPHRDCNNYSAGGAKNSSEYVEWSTQISASLKNNPAIVIVEPDALALIDCLSESDQAERLQLINQVVSIFKNNSQTSVYIDAGHAQWIPEEVMAKRLITSGIKHTAGFSLNVSNFIANSQTITYGKNISALVGANTPFVIDTSRNGRGANGEWCNPSGRALGETPTLQTGDPLIAAYLWVKTPGESDGACNGGPRAGEWWPEYAVKLVQT